MDYSRKLSILVTWVFLLMIGIEGQHDGDFMKICDLCHKDDLLDCSLTEMIQVNMTINCKLPNKMCTLGIDQSFDDFDNLTMQEIDHEWVCLLRDDSVATPINTITTNPTIPIVNEQTEGFEHLKTTTEGTFVELATTYDSLDYQGDQPTGIVRTFRSDSVPDSAKDQQPPPEETITCFVCKSSSNKDCLSNAEKLNTIECPNTIGCITYYSDGNLVRDCTAAVRLEDLATKCKSGSTSCKQCPDAQCNKMPWQQCYQCNSKDNLNCAFWSNVETVPVATCPNFNDNCLVRITKDNDTVRDCSRADAKCPHGELCSICKGPLCNSGIFPENRRRCIQCQECEDAQDPNKALPCAKFTPDEQCFLYVTAKSKMIRGCVSNIDEMQQCRMNEPKCITCGDANGCNSVPLMKDASLSCSKCNSKYNLSCAWAQPSTAMAKCEKKVLYYLQETCMTEFDPATQATVRDCSFDYGACIPEDHNCRTCSGDGCNRGSLKVQQCIQCCSAHPEQSKCRDQAEGMPPTKCPQETQTYQTKGCYSMTKGNITTRGCIAGLSENELKFCKTDGKSHCDLCVEDGCNNLLAPSRGWRTGQISLLAVFGAIFITI